MLLLLALAPGFAIAQFSPDGGRLGSTAIHRDSAQFLAWGVAAAFEPGFLDVANQDLGRVPEPDLVAVYGAPDDRTLSLGDCGQVTLSMSKAIRNEDGPDFVVFENGFVLDDTSSFLELAFVEVSSDGSYFERFPSTSLTAASVGAFEGINATRVNGFAGKASAPYGVPFDLDDLQQPTLIDLARVTHVRLVDVGGTAQAAFAKTDSDGSIIYDPYPTPFPTCGFDLDAVGALHVAISVSLSNPEPKANSTQALALTRDEAEERFPRARWTLPTGHTLGFTAVQSQQLYMVLPAVTNSSTQASTVLVFITN